MALMARRVVLAVVLAALVVAVLGGDRAEAEEKARLKKIAKCAKVWAARREAMDAPPGEKDEESEESRMGTPFAISRRGSDFTFAGVPALGTFNEEELRHFESTDCDVNNDKTAMFFALRMAQQAMTKDLSPGGIYDNMRKNVEDLGPCVDGRVFGPIEYYALSNKLDSLYNGILDWWDALTNGVVKSTNGPDMPVLGPDDVFSAVSNLRWLVEIDTKGLLDSSRANLPANMNELWADDCSKHTTPQDCVRHSGRHETTLNKETRRLDLENFKPGGRCIWRSKVEFDVGADASSDDKAKFKELLSMKDEDLTPEEKEWLSGRMKVDSGSCSVCDISKGECSQMHVELGAHTSTTVVEGTETFCRLSDDSLKMPTEQGKLHRARKLTNISRMWGCHEAIPECCRFRSNAERIAANNMANGVRDPVPGDDDKDKDGAAKNDGMDGAPERGHRGAKPFPIPIPDPMGDKKARKHAPEPIPEPMHGKQPNPQRPDPIKREERRKAKIARKAQEEFRRYEDYVDKEVKVKLDRTKMDPRSSTNYFSHPRGAKAYTYTVVEVFWSKSAPKEEAGKPLGNSADECPSGISSEDDVAKYIWLKVSYKKPHGGDLGTWTFPVEAIYDIKVVLSL